MKNTTKNTLHFALSCFLFLPAVSYYCGMQETQVHGSIGKVTFTTARTEGDVYIVTAEVTFVSREEMKNNPLAFLGSDSTEAIVRIDGQTVSQEVRFS